MKVKLFLLSAILLKFALILPALYLHLYIFAIILIVYYSKQQELMLILYIAPYNIRHNRKFLSILEASPKLFPTSANITPLRVLDTELMYFTNQNSSKLFVLQNGKHV